MFPPFILGLFELNLFSKKYDVIPNERVAGWGRFAADFCV